MKLANIKPISYLKSDAAKIVSELTESHEPLVITQNGEAKLVVQDIATYEAQQQTVALLKILALGQKEIAQGRTTPAEDVFAELDRLDREEGV
ncbi:type II toxin-antitoxin system Phd/YefM family antitoxin [Paraburkholderia sp. D15]|uniref:type II toxin-antitoxin system Phd/YefM family antitoxin n=1 Tax=Paraburkholderia sp. D15 TaxID=2880218 RepID=UPI0024789174|nr:type II toxin-antitoxin system Phd/YefM family antitoxin [Paraburkholderia sp. D15]WGS54453.1 type II toxin-antitoxin system Phd/YefM family antitoxin [Paraburkholderia sp. D15]